MTTRWPTARSVDTGADLADAPGRLVTEQHRHGAGPVAVDDGQVGVADPGGLDPHQHLTRAGAGQLELADGEGSGLRLGPGPADLLEHRPGDPHARARTASSSRSRTTAGIGTVGAGGAVDVDVDPVPQRRELGGLGVEQAQGVGDAAATHPLDPHPDVEGAGYSSSRK